jgi:hypothetical protein
MGIFCAAICAVLAASSQGSLSAFPPTVNYTSSAIDHFNFYSQQENTFELKWLSYTKKWKGPDGPILFYLGGEGQIEDFYNATGAIFEIAEELSAAVLFVEHRYYGVSLPFGENSFSPKNISYLSIEQAMADFSLFLPKFKQILGCTARRNSCQTILFGGSYGGMLVAWHRLKYPFLSGFNPRIAPTILSLLMLSLPPQWGDSLHQHQ